MNTKTQAKPPTPNHLIIGPRFTTINSEVIDADTICIILENGSSYGINKVVDLLEEYDKKKQKADKPKIFRRVRHIKQALKTALREALDDDLPNTRSP